jgi:ABC-type multidrug transport system permease subunit/ABC-type multidrug transport system ATPase subunit
MSSNIGEVSNIVAIYQASQAIYDLFEKTTVLYEGRQIYFGPAQSAKKYFEDLGWYCPPRQTTGDFLTSVTNPAERQARPGFENKVPRTPEEFEQRWRESNEFKALQAELDDYDREYLGENQHSTIQEFRDQKVARQAKHVPTKSPYTVPLGTQVRLLTTRAWRRIWNDKSATLTHIMVNCVIALIIGSIFYGTPDASAGFYAKGSVLFLAILINALTAISEIVSLYAQRPIVEKHRSYAFYHPAAEAAAGLFLDIPMKFCITTVFDLVIYFMSGLRREPAQFFLFFLITYIVTFVMSAVFRTLAAVTKTVSQAMSLSGVMVLALVIYTGFAITVPSMHPWFSWIRWINPIFYAFEILVANEFHGRQFACSSFVPPYPDLSGTTFVCDTTGAVPGQQTVSGDAFIAENYQYYYSHVWRNFGILLGFLFGFLIMYFVAVELNSSTSSTAESLVFQRGHVPAHLMKNGKAIKEDEESASERKVQDSNHDGEVKALPPQKDIFTWRDVVYDIEIKGEPRRLLDHVDGWVKPGTLTALMGVSGAGKTTLLDVLAQRTTMGVITGDMLVNGQPRDPSFQRKTGYVQQQGKTRFHDRLKAQH